MPVLRLEWQVYTESTCEGDWLTSTSYGPPVKTGWPFIFPSSMPHNSHIDAIRHNFNCEAEWLRTERVREEWQGQSVFDGDVEIYAIKGHPQTDIAYAWSYRTKEGRERVMTVLQVTPVTSATDAVRAAIAAEHRQNRP